jgi:hypothetical protein
MHDRVYMCDTHSFFSTPTLRENEGRFGPCRKSSFRNTVSTVALTVSQTLPDFLGNLPAESYS